MTAELYYAGIALIILGILIVMIGMILTILKGRGGVEGGGIVLIGPIPIIIGTSSRIIKAMLILAIIMMMFIIAVMMLWVKLW
jgi:uncharacterized protein (TIGR00304 family)